jgi:hypothetical protein
MDVYAKMNTYFEKLKMTTPEQWMERNLLYGMFIGGVKNLPDRQTMNKVI